MSSQFEINPQTGDLMIKEQLDYETMMDGTFVVAVVVSFRMITQTSLSGTVKEIIHKGSHLRSRNQNRG